MSGMNLDLAAMYGTPGAEEDQEKIAGVELFCKLAAESGLDLNQMSDQQIDAAYGEFLKMAEEEAKKNGNGNGNGEEDDDDDDESKKEGAAYEFAQIAEAKEKMAEADFLGRTMAHAFTQENALIQEAMEKEGKKAPPPSFFRRATGRAGELLTGSRLKGTREASEWARGAQKAMKEGREPTKSELKKLKLRSKEELQQAAREARIGHGKELAKVWGARAGAVGAPLGIGAGAGYAAGRKKESSAIDELALQAALEKAAEAGWDVEEAAERLMAVDTLGPPESEKLAYANDVDEAVGIRALEFLDLAGYPVEWE